MTDIKRIEDREIHAVVRAMFRRVYPRLTDRELDKLDIMVSEIYDMADVKLETCKGCDSDLVKGDACDFCPRN